MSSFIFSEFVTTFLFTYSLIINFREKFQSNIFDLRVFIHLFIILFVLVSVFLMSFMPSVGKLFLKLIILGNFIFESQGKFYVYKTFISEMADNVLCQT